MESHSAWSIGFMAAALLLASTVSTMTRNPANADQRISPIEIAVDPRVELLSIVFRVAGAQEYQRGRVSSYSADVDSHFRPFAHHPAVRRVGEIRRRYGISHDAVVKLAVHAEDAKTWRASVPLSAAETLGNRWRADVAEIFLEELRGFAETSGFEAFFAAHQSLYAETEARLKARLATADLGWLDEFFGEPSGSLRIIPGMLTGPASYGATVLRDSGADRYAIVGVEEIDESGRPQFDRAVVESVVHELCHSYLSPVLKKEAEGFREAGEALYLSQQPRMEMQAYRSGYTVMNETLTRACTHRFLLATATREEVVGDIAYNNSRGFLWIGDVSEVLEGYEADRDRYSTFADYVSELQSFFARYTRGLPHSAEELEARRPHVVGLVPINGDLDVSPGLEVIVVTFDRPMRAGTWSVVGGGPKYPATGSPAYDAQRQIFRLPVILEPDREYELWLNRGPHMSFASADGTPLAPFRISFQTGSR